jgi:hypothetical protein
MADFGHEGSGFKVQGLGFRVLVSGFWFLVSCYSDFRKGWEAWRLETYKAWRL